MTLDPAHGTSARSQDDSSTSFRQHFAGLFHIRQGHIHHPVIIKSYACMFVSLMTRAIHIELCANLTTEEFMAMLRRFCARLGIPTSLYYNNGTNFQGTRNKIHEIQQLILSKSTQSAVSDIISKSSIEWHMIPPRAPHFGRLWEAAEERQDSPP